MSLNPLVSLVSPQEDKLTHSVITQGVKEKITLCLTFEGKTSPQV